MELQRNNAPYALIGGLALSSHVVIRATADIDLLTAASSSDQIEAMLLKLGYRRLHRSSEAGHYVRDDQRVDLIHAHRPAAMRLLADAIRHTTAFGTLPVVSAEGLIGLKLQVLANDPRRPAAAPLSCRRASIRGS